MKSKSNDAANALRKGRLIAYPTESIWGLGCDPFNETAILELLKLKNRDINKGLILIASNWEQIKDLTKPIDPSILQNAFDHWPGLFTFLFPASTKAPKWITGDHDSIALRITNHPIAKALCDEFGGPIVSTSANISSMPVVQNIQEAKQLFQNQVDCYVEGETGGAKPSKIIDIITGKVLRD